MGRVLLATVTCLFFGGTNTGRLVAAAFGSGQDRPSPELQSRPATPDTTRPDSATTFRDLRNHQIRFERFRRANLNWTYRSYGQCEERIGRFCITFGDDDETPERRPEPASIAEKRNELIEKLSAGAVTLPGDWWIAGQRTRYLVEADRLDEALRAAAECADVQRWWCHALAGFALHRQDRPAESEGAFDEALALMPDEVRCEWTDLSELLQGKLRKVYRRLECAQRRSLQQRILWMADPFHSRPGNEVRTEHFSRLVMDRLQDVGATPEGLAWADDLHRILMRYGWPTGWERIRNRPTDPGRPSLVSYYPNGGRYYLPNAEQVTSPYDIKPGDWDVDPRRPRATYLVAHDVSSVKPADVRTVMFRRGDSTLVVAFYDWDDDSITGSVPVEAALVASGDANSPMATAWVNDSGPTGTLVLIAPSEPQVLSLELRAIEKKRAGWARIGADLGRFNRPGPKVSDVLVVDVTDSLPETLDDAVGSIRGDRPFYPGGRVGLYWELYGLDPHRSQVVSASLTMTRLNKGFFRRVIEFTPLASGKPPVSMTWRDVKPTEAGFLPRSLALDLPPGLASGRYGLRLVIGFDNGEAKTVETEITVVDRPKH